MASSKNSKTPAIDSLLQSQLVAAFGKQVLQEGFAGVPASIRQIYRRIPGNEDTARMTPTEFLIMADLWSVWWSGDRQQAPSIAQLSEHTGKSERQIQRYLHRMAVSGWVLIIPQHGLDGQQLPNWYDFSPFLRRLLEYVAESHEEVQHG
ncbi:MAG TPA: helix-turn-helix domain-containing protein [Ktedonobacteraceae bacterium]|nr:helix-turn-helix domain-containing protein [Ktedonobacteraceae bacterium]